MTIFFNKVDFSFWENQAKTRRDIIYYTAIFWQLNNFAELINLPKKKFIFEHDVFLNRRIMYAHSIAYLFEHPVA